MPDMAQLAMMLLQRNPKVANSPQGREFIQILQSGDAAKGEQMARNFCQTYGDTPEQAYEKAKNFFNM